MLPPFQSETEVWCIGHFNLSYKLSWSGIWGNWSMMFYTKTFLECTLQTVYDLKIDISLNLFFAIITCHVIILNMPWQLCYCNKIATRSSLQFMAKKDVWKFVLWTHKPLEKWVHDIKVLIQTISPWTIPEVHYWIITSEFYFSSKCQIFARIKEKYHLIWS